MMAKTATAVEMVREFCAHYTNEDTIPEAELVEAFRLAYGRAPDQEDWDTGLWSLINVVAQEADA